MRGGVGSDRLPDLTTTPELTWKAKAHISTRRVHSLSTDMHSHGDFPLTTTAGDQSQRVYATLARAGFRILTIIVTVTLAAWNTESVGLKS